MFEDYPDVLTTEQARTALGIGMNAMYRLLSEKKINHMRVGRKILIPKRFLIDYVLGECYADTTAAGNPSCHLKEVLGP